MKIIGDSELFAVEFAVDESDASILGRLRVWAGGRCFGTLEDTVPLLGACRSLSLLLSPERTCRIPALLAESDSPKRVFDILSSDEFNHDRFMFNIDESTDDFKIFALSDGERIHLIWQRLPDTFFDYPCDDGAAQYASVNASYVERVVNEFESIIMGARTDSST